MRRTLACALVALLTLATAAACADDDTSGSGDGDGVPDQEVGEAVDGVPPEVVEHAGDWPLPGRDHANSRAVTDSPITADTVDQLEEVWRVPLPGSAAFGNAATVPLVLGDRVYVQDLQSNVRAVDLATGEVRWETLVEAFQVGPNGVAVGWDRVFATKGMREVMALDAETGQELWSVELVRTPTEGIDIQPQVAGGLVLVSTVPISAAGQYVGGDRGILHALDPETGEVVWTFDTVDDGEELWGDPETNSGGGAWYPPAVDAEAGLVYWGIANPAPFPGVEGAPNGASRPGPNLYTNSVVALHLDTGELAWFHQVIEHDLHDRDHVHTMLVPTDEGTVLVSTGKSGLVVGHDPLEGGELWRTSVGIHRNDDLGGFDGLTEVWPGLLGGVLTPPSHADGVVYVATLNSPSSMEPDVPAPFATALGSAPGEVVAVRASDGEVLWATEVDGDPLGGTTVVGDLVFTATFAGAIYALDRETGAIVWERPPGGGINGWPAVIDDTILWPVGLADPPALVALSLPEG